MKAAAPAQLRLLDLQAEDAMIAQLKHRKTALPEHAAISNGMAARAKLGSALVGVRTQASDLKFEVEKVEADLVPVRERLARDIKRRDDGVVTDARGFAALNDEIDHLGKRISDLEDAELEAMEQLDAAIAQEQQLAGELAELESSLRALIAARDEQIAQLDAEAASRQQARDRIAADLPSDLIGLYDRIRARSGGVGAVVLNGRQCSGCQLQATASALAAYTSAAPDEVLRCEECDRVLVRTSAAGA